GLRRGERRRRGGARLRSRAGARARPGLGAGADEEPSTDGDAERGNQAHDEQHGRPGRQAAAPVVGRRSQVYERHARTLMVWFLMIGPSSQPTDWPWSLTYLGMTPERRTWFRRHHVPPWPPKLHA